MKITTTEAIRVDGKHIDAGTILDLSENDVMAIVSAGRGTIDPEKSAEAVKAAKAAKAAETAK